jgi:hypothetical protein
LVDLDLFGLEEESDFTGYSKDDEFKRNLLQLRETCETAMLRRKEEIIIREIPEVNENIKRLNAIPLMQLFNKKRMKRDYKYYFIKPDPQYYDSDADNAENAPKRLKKRRKSKLENVESQKSLKAMTNYG